VAQGIGPEFKPQYHQKEKKKSLRDQKPPLKSNSFKVPLTETINEIIYLPTTFDR
jgi:hypothetical protein